MESPTASDRPRRAPLDLAWASLAFLIPTIVALLSRMGAIDLAYHLRAGADVLAGHIPRFDTYTFTVAGTPWLDQQWGAQAILTLLYRAGGWPTLAAAQALLIGATYFLLYLAVRQAGARVRTASLLTIGGFLVGSPGLAMRPQLLALPLFAALLWVTAGRLEHPARLWAAPVLAAICANLHGSFTLFPLVLGLAWLEDLRTRSPGVRRTLIVTGATTLATLLNPFGVQVWSYALALSTNPVIRQTISEWAPLTIGTVPGWFAIGSALAVAVYLIRRTRPTPSTALLTLGIFFLLAMSAQRAIVWWGMVAPVVLGALMRPEPDPVPVQTEAMDAKANGGSRAPAYIIIGALVAFILVLAPWWRGNSPDRFLRAAPPGLTEAARQLPDGTRLLVDQPWGSWFEFALPRDPVFVDSRIEIVPADIWDDYGQVGFAGARWNEVLDHYEVGAIVANADWELLPLLEADPGWRSVYKDDDGELFVRA